MAVIAAVGVSRQKGVVEIKWTAITEADTGGPVEIGNARSATVTFSGTFDGATDFELVGSDDGVTYSILDDIVGNPIDTIAAALTVQIGALPRYIGVNRTAGGATTDVDVTLTLKGCDN